MSASSESPDKPKLLGDLPPFPHSIGITSPERLRESLVASVCRESTYGILSLNGLTLRYGATAKKFGSPLMDVLAELQAQERLVVHRIESANKTYVFDPEQWRALCAEIAAGRMDWERQGVWLKGNIK